MARSSRAALIRRAIDGLLASERDGSGGDAFGLWAGRAGDGLAYQREIRGEW